jgi:VWFA-related protein
MKKKTAHCLKWGVICLCAQIFLAGALAGRENQVNLQRIDLTSLPEVKLYLTVIDEDGSSVLGLTDQEIVITLDDKPQVLSSLISALEGDEHLAVALLFDRSGSMKEALEETKAAAAQFVRRMSAGDQICIISFDDRVRVDAEFTADRAVVEEAIKNIALGRDTALFDAVNRALEMLRNVATNRQAVVILSDGKDTKSGLGQSDVLSAAKEQGVPLYTINLTEEGDQENLTKLSSETGGAFFKAAVPADLLELYQKIAEQLNNQYLITFNTDVDERFHNLKISVQEPGAAVSEAKKEFVASKGMGIRRGRVDALERGLTKREVLFWAALGAFCGLLLGLLILIILRIGRPDINLLSPLTIALFLSALLLGTIFGVFYALSK